MARKSYNEKLNDNKNMPEIVQLTDPAAISRYHGERMLLAPPLAYDALMRQVPEGKVTTVPLLREKLALDAGADFTCPLTAGIFVNIVAQASEEREIDETPYWRTLKKDGELNDKYPGGIDGHRRRLIEEGHLVVQKGKRFFVADIT